MADLLDRIKQQTDARVEELRPLAEEARDLQRARDALEEQPAPRAGRAAVRRTARARARSPRGDTAARVIDHVAAHPGTTAADIASALGLKRNSAATRLTQLTKQGKLAKARRGYTVP